MSSSTTQKPTSFKDVNWDDAPHFVNADNRRIFCRYWKPEGTVRGLVFICHGVAEHARWYSPIAEKLTKEGLLVCGHDQVGHGLSEGDRVHINYFYEYTRDLLQLVNKVKQDHPDVPVFLVGHSMGGAVAIKSGMDNPDLYRGIILIAPAIVPNPESATWFKVTLAKIAAWLLPQLQVGTIDKSWVSRDKAVQEAYEQDPLNWHGGLKAKWAVCLLSTLDEIQAGISSIKWPFLIFHGSDDKLCEISGSKLLQERAASADKTLKIIDGAYHQVHSEPDGVGEQCKQDIVDWITARL